MKKTLKIIIALLLVISLSLITSCGKKDDKTNGKVPGSDLPIIDLPED